MTSDLASASETSETSQDSSWGDWDAFRVENQE